MRYILVLFLGSAVLFVAACTAVVGQSTTPSTKAKPIPAGPDAYTSKDYEKVYHEWRHRVNVDSYKTYGVRDPKWDEAAERFLELYHLWNIRKSGDPPSYDLGPAIDAAVDSGCTDPLVLLHLGIFQCSIAKNAEALSYLERALEGFQNSKYPRCCARMAPIYLIKTKKLLANLSPEENSRLMDIVIKWTAEATTDGSFKPTENRIMLDALYMKQEDLFCKSRLQLLAALKAQKNIDKYFINVVEGMIEIDEAWEDRGNAQAHQVSEMALDEFLEHLKNARQLLTEAWKLNPKYPEAPTHMIPVASADSKTKDEARIWFDRAVAAQLNYMPAYDAYRYALLPRRGGSIEQMYSFALECLNTKRYDTLVPWQLFSTLFSIQHELYGSKEYWTSLKSQESLDEMFRGYVDDRHIDLKPRYISIWAATKWYCGQYKEAKQKIDELGNSVRKNEFKNWFKVSYEDVCAMIEVELAEKAAKP